MVVLLLGVFTRLTDAGLSCPAWPGCYGHFSWLSNADAIARAERLYPDNLIEHQKTMVDMAHRYAAGFLGLLAVALAVISWLRREEEGYPFRLPTFILFLVVWQSLFGMWSVTLKLWPQIVTLHLLTGMVTCSLLWLLTLRLSGREWRLAPEVMDKLGSVKSWLLVVITVVLLQIILGGWTSANYAAFACIEFPTCQGEWWPEMDFKNGFDLTQTIGPNYLGGKLESEARVAIHVMHRLGGLMLALLIIGFAGGDIPKFPVNLALVKEFAVVGVFWGNFTRFEPQTYAENMKELLGWYHAGHVKPLIEGRYPLAQAAEVLTRVLGRGAVGKIVLIP
jgi:cytochrome c oxidase assembly protein subunit 15